MKKIELSHVVLYSKGWYKQTDLVEDMKKCLTADGYSGELFTKDDVIKLLLNNIEGIDDSRVGLSDFYNAIQEENCWNYGYCTDKNFRGVSTVKYESYDADTAVILWCLSILRFTKVENYVIVKPNFDVLPMNEYVTLEKVEEFFN